MVEDGQIRDKEGGVISVSHVSSRQVEERLE